jgi:enoyl-[acyl-carrier-protein] reductase (NADH)
MTQNAGLMRGKHGVVLGVADNRSIANAPDISLSNSVGGKE